MCIRDSFSTGFRHGYVQKIYASLREGRASGVAADGQAIEVVGRTARRSVPVSRYPLYGGEAGPAQAATATVAIADPTAGRPSRAETMPSRYETVAAAASPAPAPAMAEPPVPVLSPQTVAAAQPAPADNFPPIGRAVPTGTVVARAVVAQAEPAPAEAASEPKKRARGSDQAFVASDPNQDDAFVF